MGTKHYGRIYKWTVTSDWKSSGKGTEKLQKPLSLGVGGVVESIPKGVEEPKL